MPDFRIGTSWTMTRTRAEARAFAEGLAAADAARSPRFAIPPFTAMREVGALPAETLAERESGRAAEVLETQVRGAMSRVAGSDAPILLAYEPALGGRRPPRHSGALRRNHRRREMKLAIAGDSAGGGPAKALADHRRGKHEVSEISPGAKHNRS